MELCKSQGVSRLPQLQPTSVLLPGWHLATSFGSSGVYRSCFPSLKNICFTSFETKVSILDEFGNRSKSTIHRGFLTRCYSFICIVWSPQNGWHLMTPAYWRFPFWFAQLIAASGLVTWWVLKRTRYPRANRLALSTQGGKRLEQCRHRMMESMHTWVMSKCTWRWSKQAVRLSYHMMSLRANEDRCSLALILKAHICE